LDRPPNAPPLAVGRFQVIDHLYVTTGSIKRTSSAFERAGVTVRSSDPDSSRADARLGTVGLGIIASEHAPSGRARFGGIAFTVQDLDALFDELGQTFLSPPKPARQPSRRIAAARPPLGLGLPVAFMTPPPESGEPLPGSWE
ncbi:MAG: hypothetical protein JO147_13605, partial [Actinobacteria bacterium]|nr:hypothetical protein [Actinomycetota bacterium]